MILVAFQNGVRFVGVEPRFSKPLFFALVSNNDNNMLKYHTTTKSTPKTCNNILFIYYCALSFCDALTNLLGIDARHTKVRIIVME